MSEHDGQIILPATAARVPAFISEVILYSLAYDYDDATDNDNRVTALSAQIQISKAPIGIVQKLSVEPMDLAKRLGKPLLKPIGLS